MRKSLSTACPCSTANWRNSRDRTTLHAISHRKRAFGAERCVGTTDGVGRDEGEGLGGTSEGCTGLRQCDRPIGQQLECTGTASGTRRIDPTSLVEVTPRRSIRAGISLRGAARKHDYWTLSVWPD